MIPFFRKIHQNLLAEVETSACLKYAIGEISFKVTGFLDIPNFKTKNEFLPAGKGRDQGVGIATRKIIPFHPHLIALAKKLRNKMTIGEIAL